MTQDLNQWNLLHARAKSEETELLARLGHKASLDELKQYGARCALWVREFREYQEELVGALEPLPETGHDAIGREKELRLLQAVMERPVTSVAILLGYAGSGKSALVEEFAKQSNRGTLENFAEPRKYMVLALRLGSLSALPRNELQAALATIMPTLKKFEIKAQKALGDPSFRIILFIDEVHMMVTIFGEGTKIGGDVMKDMLARSPIRVISATTRREYDSTIAVDKPLAERFKTIEIQELPRHVVHDIARNWWNSYAPFCPELSDDVIEYVISANHNYRPDSAEPRKTLDILEDLVSYCNRTGLPATKETVDTIFHDRFSIMLGFNIDADEVYGNLKSRVLGQPAALQMWNLMLHATPYKNREKANRPIFSALLTGNSGVGKPCAISTLTPTPNGWVRHGDLKKGDLVFDREGKPVEVLEVFDRPQEECYRVTLADGRSEIFAKDHLFGIYTAKQRVKQNNGVNVQMHVMSVKELLDEGIYVKRTIRGEKLDCHKFYVPQNGAVQFEEKELACPPYVMGAMIGDGCCTESSLTLSSGDEDLVLRIANLIGAPDVTEPNGGYSWKFKLANPVGRQVHYRTKDVVPELYGKNAFEKRIPKEYMEGSIEQRFELVRGMMDTDGSITVRKDRMPQIRYFTVHKELAEDLQHVLFTLGIQSSLTCQERMRHRTGVNGDYIHEEVSYIVNIMLPTEDAHKLFWLPRKKELALKATETYQPKRTHNFNCVAIESIEYVGVMDCNCILTKSDEHLYQVGWNPMVTHNTESVKAVSEVLYPNENALVTLNMPDFSQPKDEPLFRKELGEILRHKPNAVILFDEFEKAADNIRRSMLSILDEGLVNFTVLNREGREETNQASLRDAICICTTNAGAGVFKDDNKFSTVDNDGDGEGELSFAMLNSLDRLSRDLRENLMQNGFPPEMLGRFDQIIPYRALSEKTTLMILDRKLQRMLDDLKLYHDIEVTIDEPPIWDDNQYGRSANPVHASDICVYVAYQCAQIADSDSGGARRLDNELQSQVFYRIIRAKMEYPDCNKFHMKVRGLISIPKADGSYVCRLNNEVKEGIAVEPITDESNVETELN